MLHRNGPVDYKIWGVMQQCVYETKTYDICSLQKSDGWGRWKWELLSPDGVAPSRTVDVSASVNLPLHHKVHKFSSGTGSYGWSRKKGRKRLWWYMTCKNA